MWIRATSGELINTDQVLFFDLSRETKTITANFRQIVRGDGYSYINIVLRRFGSAEDAERAYAGLMRALAPAIDAQDL